MKDILWIKDSYIDKPWNGWSVGTNNSTPFVRADHYTQLLDLLKRHHYLLYWILEGEYISQPQQEEAISIVNEIDEVLKAAFIFPGYNL